MKKTDGIKAIGVNKKINQSYQLHFKANQKNYSLIKALAIKYDVPVIKNPALTKALQDLPTNYDLPKELIIVLDVILNQIDTVS